MYFWFMCRQLDENNKVCWMASGGENTTTCRSFVNRALVALGIFYQVFLVGFQPDLVTWSRNATVSRNGVKILLAHDCNFSHLNLFATPNIHHQSKHLQMIFFFKERNKAFICLTCVNLSKCLYLFFSCNPYSYLLLFYKDI